MLKESVLSMAPARSVRTPSDHKNAVSPTQGHSSHFSKSCPRCCKIEEGVPKSCGSKLLWMAEMDMGGHGETFWRHLWDTWEVSALCPQNVPKMSPLCPPCVPKCLQNGTHLALTWHSLLLLSLTLHSLRPNGTIIPIKINKKNVLEHMLTESALSVAPARSVTPSDHKNAVSPTWEHSSHFSKSCPKVLQNWRRGPKKAANGSYSGGWKWTWGAHGRHFETFVRHVGGICPVSPKCPQNDPPVSALCPQMSLKGHSLGTHLALTRHSLAAPGTHYALTLT